ncbi:MAG: hypothetical protein ACODAF_08525 [Actinomycetota bacterium]
MTILAHAGHSHGPDPALIALIVVAIVLAITAATAAVRARNRSRPDTGTDSEITT